MSSQTDWTKAREEYANRVPDPANPKLPQSGNWTDVELAFFLDEEIDTFRKKLKTKSIPHLSWGDTKVVKIDEFVRGRLYGSEAEEEDDPEAGKRERVDLATPERPVRGGGKRSRDAGKEATESNRDDLRPRKGRKG